MSNRKGFTLIELLIVVVIIGISGGDRHSEVREHQAEGGPFQHDLGPA